MKKKSAKTDAGLPKVKGLFDHINHLREVADPHYFDTLSEADQKSWSNYMVCRFLSMQTDIVDTINELQFYTFLPPREFYRICTLVVPRGRGYFPYVKGKKEGKWKPETVEILCKHFEESERNVLEFLEILTEDDLREIVSKYGYTDKEVEKLIRQEVKK